MWFIMKSLKKKVMQWAEKEALNLTENNIHETNMVVIGCINLREVRSSYLSWVVYHMLQFKLSSPINQSNPVALVVIISTFCPFPRITTYVYYSIRWTYYLNIYSTSVMTSTSPSSDPLSIVPILYSGRGGGGSSSNFLCPLHTH